MQGPERLAGSQHPATECTAGQEPPWEGYSVPFRRPAAVSSKDGEGAVQGTGVCMNQ